MISRNLIKKPSFLIKKLGFWYRDSFQFEILSFLIEIRNSRQKRRFFDQNTRFFNQKTKFFYENTRFFKDTWQMASIYLVKPPLISKFFFLFVYTCLYSFTLVYILLDSSTFVCSSLVTHLRLSAFVHTRLVAHLDSYTLVYTCLVFQVECWKLDHCNVTKRSTKWKNHVTKPQLSK